MWPKKKTLVSFAGHHLVLFPSTAETDPSLHIKLHKLSSRQGMTLINRFLSILAWLDDGVVENLGGISGHTNARPIPRHKGSQLLYTDVFPLAVELHADKKALRALALYREANGLKSIPLRFLNFFKILNIVWIDKKEKKGGENPIVEGIRRTLPYISDKDAVTRIEALRREKVSDIPQYLYASGRCAVAHAYSDPLADPDDIEDLHRLSQDIWIIKPVAQHVMTNILKIPAP
jgi:hypothetical protein